MLLDLLARYLEEDVRIALRGIEDAYIERYEENILVSSRVNLRIRVRFLGGDLLELNETVIGESERIRHLGYRYHLQDRENDLVFRYDNPPHFPELEHFPHHKHLPNKVIPVQQPSLLEVIEEAELLAQCTQWEDCHR